MGLDPLTLGLAASAGGSLIGAYGQNKAAGQAQQRFQQTQAQGQGMMKTGADPYQAMLMGILGGNKQPTALDPMSGQIDTKSVMQNFNPGQDALMQFLRSDPSKQMSFDTSKAFDALQAQDSRTAGNSVAALNANFGGLGQRFGGAAMHQTSDLLANLGAQTGARNAGIFQQSFENQQNRSLQGSGQMLQAAMAQGQQGNAAAQMAAQLGIANQGNQQWNQQFNQNNRNQWFQQQLQGTQAGFGMQNANDQYNLGLFNSMNGIATPQGNGYTALGGGIQDIGQLLAFLPMLQNMNKPTPKV